MVFISVISIMFLFSGCSFSAMSSPGNNTSEQEPLPAELEFSGSISFVNKSDQELSEDIQILLNSYFQDYFEALSLLESRDVTSYFYKEKVEGAESAIINQHSLDYLINLRKLQKNDLTLNEYVFTGEILSILPAEKAEAEDAGDVAENREAESEADADLESDADDYEDASFYEIKINEYNTLNFSFLPEIDAHTAGVEHAFIIREDSNGANIVTHNRMEDVNYLIEDLFNHEKEAIEEVTDVELTYDADVILKNITEKMLAEAKVILQQREESKKNPTENGNLPSADHLYDREAAMAYAMEWVSPEKIKRNPEWLAYDERGGNCNNYISQSIHAGGIPMDTKGYILNQWKFFDDRINGRQSAWGRSPSWAGVNEFYNYVSNNDGSGMVAKISNDFFDGEIGDIIIYGTEERWKHAVIITDIIYDDEGTFVDYLINSNTTDRIHYPVSAYGYHNTSLIKIIGWNE